MHDERPPQPVPRPWRRLFARAIQTVHGTHRPFHGCAFSASLSALASVLLPTNLHRGRETAPRSTAQLESAASRALSHSAFQKSSQFANTHQSASPYGVASAEICAARVLTNDLSPVMSLISEYSPDLEAERGDRITAAAVYSSSAISFLHRMLYRSEYDAPLNSGNKGKFGDTSATGLREAGASSRSIRNPTKGFPVSPKAPSRKAVFKSTAVPSASSQRLFALLPNDGPTWDLNSIAAMSLPWFITSRSHNFVGRKKPGSR